MRSIEVGVGADGLLEDGRGCDVGGKSQSHKKQVASISRINHWNPQWVNWIHKQKLKSTGKKEKKNHLLSKKLMKQSLNVWGIQPVIYRNQFIEQLGNPMKTLIWARHEISLNKRENHQIIFENKS